MAYIKQALGTTNGNTVDPSLGSFSKELMMDNEGPFIYYTFDQVHKAGLPPMTSSAADQDARLFLAWLTRYDPDSIIYITKVMLLHDAPIEKPKWVAEKKIRFKQATYDLCKSSIFRVQSISMSQGLTEADPADYLLFMDWWKKYDAAGCAAATVLGVSNKVPYQVPAQLFDFWKVNNQGNLAPPSSLLGLGLWCMCKRNWIWIGAGAVGGAAAYKMLQKRRARKELEQAETLAANCPSCK